MLDTCYEFVNLGFGFLIRYLKGRVNDNFIIIFVKSSKLVHGSLWRNCNSYIIISLGLHNFLFHLLLLPLAAQLCRKGLMVEVNTDYKSVRGENFTFSNVLEKFCFLCFMFLGMSDKLCWHNFGHNAIV